MTSKTSGPLSDTRLQIAILEADLRGLPEAAAADDDRLRLHSALASAYGRTFSIRGNVAYWTGIGGDLRQGLRLFQELLLDEDSALGSHHPNTLKTRANIARLTGASGNPPEALRLFRALLADQEKILGLDHPETRKTRENIAALTKSQRT